MAKASDATLRGIQVMTSLLASVVRRRPHPSGPRAYGYRRVSREDQVKSGLGLAAQRTAIRQAAKRLGVGLWRVRTDGGRSGELPPDKRPGLLAVLRHIRPRDVLIVAKRDRLSRDDLAMKLLEVGLDAAEIRIFSAAGEGTQVRLDDPDGVLERGINDMYSRSELLKIRQRTRAALRRRRLNGLRTGGVPYGFDEAEDGRLVPNRTEQKALGLMRERRREGRSYSEIASELTAIGVKPRGSAWRKSGVRTILRTAAKWDELSKSNKR